MLEALWAVTFAAPKHQDMGAGIVVLETGRVLGGDNQFVYVGDYKMRPDQVVEARVSVRRHFNWPGGESIFGPIDKFELELTGKPAHDHFTMQGQMVGRPSETIILNFRRVAELP